jgi:hypothetical protein
MLLCNGGGMLEGMLGSAPKLGDSKAPVLLITLHSIGTGVQQWYALWDLNPYLTV